MARKGITYEEVANVANDLKAQGIQPSMLLVQTKTGGSFTTVGNHLARWRTENTTTIQADEIPPEIQSKAIEIVSACWNVANIEAKTKYAKELQETREAKADMAEEIKQLKAALESVETDKEAAEDQLEAAKRETEKLKMALERKGGELESIRGLYQELLNKDKIVKLPANRPASGKKKAHPPETKAESGNTPAQAEQL